MLLLVLTGSLPCSREGRRRSELVKRTNVWDAAFITKPFRTLEYKAELETLYVCMMILAIGLWTLRLTVDYSVCVCDRCIQEWLL